MPMPAYYEAIPSEDTTLLPSPLTPVGEERNRSRRSWVSTLRKAAAPLAAVVLVLMGVSIVACPHKMPMFQSMRNNGLRGGEVDILGMSHMTESPTLSPTTSPTTSPTLSPTVSPTLSPTVSPTLSPTLSPVRDFEERVF